MFCYFRDFAFKQVILQVESFVLVAWLICALDLCVDLFGESVEQGGGTVVFIYCFIIRPFLTWFFVRVRSCWDAGVFLRRCDFALPGWF